MRRHRAITLVVMMLLAVGALAVLAASAVGTFDAHSMIALAVVLVAAAAGGVAFSWKRYFSRNPGR